MRNNCEGVDDTTCMLAFIGGLHRGSLLRHKLQCEYNAQTLNLNDMIATASNMSAADDDAGGIITASAFPSSSRKNNNNSNKRKAPADDQKAGGSDMVAATFQQRGQGGSRGRGRGVGSSKGQQRTDKVATAAGTHASQTYKEYRDMPCLAHIDPATGKSTHTNRHCKWVNSLKEDPEAGYKRARKPRPRGKGGKNKEKPENSGAEDMEEDESPQDPKEDAADKSGNRFGKRAHASHHTFLGTPSVRQKKSALRALNATVPAVPQYVKWSEIPCTFDRSDHPAFVPKECYAMVVSPRIDGYDFSKCLMDGGASLNIMYLETLEKMNLTKE